MDLLESPKEGRMPTLLVHPLGPRMELPVSVPKPPNARLAATPVHGKNKPGVAAYTATSFSY